jgi:hypothetical protein
MGALTLQDNPELLQGTFQTMANAYVAFTCAMLCSEHRTRSNSFSTKGKHCHSRFTDKNIDREDECLAQSHTAE